MHLKVLVISDSHDNLTAVNGLLRKKHYSESNYVIHLGDIISPFTLIKFLNTGKRIIGVFGNNDGDKNKLKELCGSLQDQPLRFSLGDFEITLFHGFSSPDMTRELIYSLAKDHAFEGGRKMILYGHTHKAEIRKFGSVLVINPGALSGYLADRQTYAFIEIWDTAVKANVFDLRNGEVIISDVVSYE